MPYKSTGIKIAGTKFDRRRKLTEDQKDEIRKIGTTMSQRKLAKKFNVSRRLIVFILYPERLVACKQSRAERGGSKIYYDKDKHRISMKEHRHYKQKLYKKGKIK